MRTEPQTPKTLALLLVGLVCLGPACHRDALAEGQRHGERGDSYIASGKYAEAILEYRNSISFDASNGAVHAKLAEAYLKTGKPNDAAGEYIRAADLTPDDDSLQIKAGTFLLLANRADDAKLRAEKVLTRAPRNVDAQLLLANAQAGLRDIDGALAQIEEALRIDPNRAGIYSSLGALELSRGKREAAERAFQRAVEIQGDVVEPHVALANFYWLTDRRDLAEASLSRALSIDPRNPLVNRLLANFYIATNRREQAETPLRVVFETSGTPASAFALAEHYIAMGKDAPATEILANLTKGGHVSVPAEVRLAGIEHRHGQKAEAYQRLDRVLSDDSGNLQPLLMKSSLLLSDGQFDLALQSATMATERHPNSPPAFFVLGRVQAARRESDLAIAAFQEVLRLNPRATEAKVALSQLNLSQGRIQASLGFAAEALANEPRNANAQLLYVRGLLAQGELDRAESELKKLIARYPTVAAVQVEYAKLLGRRGDIQKATAAFERAIQLDGKSLEAFSGLVALDLSVRNFKQARNRVDTRLASNAASAPLLTFAGRTYAAGGDLAGAEALFRKALERDNTYLSAYGALGTLFASQGRLREARAEFEALAERMPKPVVPLTMIGLLLQAEGDHAGARTKFERVMQIDPQAAVAANNLAWIYADRGGNLDVALQLAQTAQKQLPDVAEINDTLGFIYYKKNLASLAISTLRVSAASEPGNPTYQYHLGLAYAGAGDSERAQQHLKRALSLNASFAGSQDARDRLSSLLKR